ncbi:hypothetical protein V5O48_004557 [Marasmius crinis-equi]|uniref:Uncharacterized protein n=1 Tax=Marasmius crinis-equi TaxID=585013 RepID=A0ABR3FQ95_9AGAR
MWIGASWDPAYYDCVHDYFHLKGYGLDGQQYAQDHNYPELVTGNPHEAQIVKYNEPFPSASEDYTDGKARAVTRLTLGGAAQHFQHHGLLRLTSTLSAVTAQTKNSSLPNKQAPLSSREGQKHIITPETLGSRVIKPASSSMRQEQKDSPAILAWRTNTSQTNKHVAPGKQESSKDGIDPARRISTRQTHKIASPRKKEDQSGMLFFNEGYKLNPTNFTR